MKKVLFALSTLFLSIGCIHAQEVDFTDVRGMRYTNMGAMKNGEKIEGYYTFYQVHKSKKSTSYDKKHFELVFMDANMVETKRVDLFRQKDSDLLSVDYNGSHFLFIFRQQDGARLVHETVFMDKEGNEIESIVYDEKKKGLFTSNPALGVAVRSSLSIPNSGFALMKFDKALGFQTSVARFDNKGKKLWETDMLRKKAYTTYDLLLANEEFIVALYYLKPKLLSTSVAPFIKIIDSNTGDIISETKIATNQKFLMPLGAHYDAWKQEVIIYGEYFGVKKNGAPNVKDKQGVFFDKMKPDGTDTGREFASWEKSINPKMAKTSKVEKGEKRSVMIHDVISKPDGGYYVIGEQYNKVVSGGAVALKMVSNNADISVMKIAIYDMLVMEFDSELKIQNIDVVEKQKVNGHLREGMGLVNEDKLAYMLKLAGVFDYSFTTFDDSMESWTVTYLNYDRTVEGKRVQKIVIGSIKQGDDGKISSSKYNIDDNPTNVRIAPAKEDHLAIFKYYRKDKNASFELTKP